ncbi:beta-glucoside-specific PTS transporter subunit IIABC [Oenococcus oeni]|uniref:beta-glucoside-specific PTS transporter subunit IIABC n=1 Tax=Oenococcus oeni TaxID=1247 RepID=UPI000277B2E7|nr:beta-glucoside-specific PTS transporter subunit IIABC [Oenococcus oeni]AZZ60833.1 PTS transporter subunit EIIC [Oenococcus sp. UCMA 16435]MDI4585295.1 PTS beta-glucoside transporter subunit EIIBCA [Oenococcus sp. UCMA 14587]EJN98988.1 PTS system, beta-glucoside-specific IIA/IIB/IIC component [Oenococcus oeni AWRIB419]EKP89869.1 PTS system, beta-glucoside-specific IIA/IIB/IIC component [Oenococcus oeni DSM 20252 = AWRIB129]KEK01635.1 PTS beta-glucoside transporter subunit IIABC [Oenococcus o
MSIKDSAKQIYDTVGGEANINYLTHCVTRLRFRLKDESKVDDEKVKQIPGVMGINHQNGQYQVIIGNAVSDYYDQVIKLGDFPTDESGDSNKTDTKEEKGNLFDQFTSFISSCMSPLIPALIGGGMIKVILILLTTVGWMSDKSQTYTILSVFGDAPFYFLPIELAITASKYHKVNQMMAVIAGAILIHPNFITLVNSGKAIHLMGLPVTAASYSSSVIPILLIVWAMKYLEAFLEKVVPSSFKSILKPLLEIFIVGVVSLVIIGPIGTWAGELLSGIVLLIQKHAAWLAMPLMAAFMPLIVMTGMHWAFSPIFLAASIASPDSLILPAMLAANIGQGAASLAVAVKTKNKNTRQIASAAAVSALLAGVTEPALYGVTLKYKKPLYASMISGAITGLFMGIVNLKAFAFAVPSILAIPQFVNKAIPNNFIYALIVLVASLVITFVLTLVFGFDDGTPALAVDDAKTPDTPESNIESGAKDTKKVFSPVKGEMINLDSVNDPTFAQKMLGDGVAVIPEDGKFYAPFDGVVETVFPTKHAIGLKSDSGIELLMHIGLDTVELKGEPYDVKVKANQRVKKGDLLVNADLDKIKKAGYETVTPLIVTNTKDFVEIVPNEKTTVDNGTVSFYVV